MENENLKPKFTKEGKSARSLSINEEANEHSQLLKRLDFAPKLG